MDEKNVDPPSTIRIRQAPSRMPWDELWRWLLDATGSGDDSGPQDQASASTDGVGKNRGSDESTGSRTARRKRSRSDHHAREKKRGKPKEGA